MLLSLNRINWNKIIKSEISHLLSFSGSSYVEQMKSNKHFNSKLIFVSLVKSTTWNSKEACTKK